MIMPLKRIYCRSRPILISISRVSWARSQRFTWSAMKVETPLFWLSTKDGQRDDKALVHVGADLAGRGELAADIDEQVGEMLADQRIALHRVLFEEAAQAVPDIVGGQPLELRPRQKVALQLLGAAA